MFLPVLFVIENMLVKIRIDSFYKETQQIFSVSKNMDIYIFPSHRFQGKLFRLAGQLYSVESFKNPFSKKWLSPPLGQYCNLHD